MTFFSATCRNNVIHELVLAQSHNISTERGFTCIFSSNIIFIFILNPAGRHASCQRPNTKLLFLAVYCSSKVKYTAETWRLHDSFVTSCTHLSHFRMYAGALHAYECSICLAVVLYASGNLKNWNYGIRVVEQSL